MFFISVRHPKKRNACRFHRHILFGSGAVLRIILPPMTDIVNG
jgi:hypothetical protein